MGRRKTVTKTEAAPGTANTDAIEETALQETNTQAEPSAESGALGSIEEYIDKLLTEDRDVDVAVDSLESRVGYGSLLREMHHAFGERVAFFRSDRGGSLSPDEARARAYHACKDEAEAERIFHKLMRTSLDFVDFTDLYELHPVAPRMAEGFWEMMKKEAGDKFVAGYAATEAMYPVHYMRTAWNVASYLGLRDSFIEEWRPRGGIELSLIDMLAEAFLMYQFWVKQSVTRQETRSREVHPDYEKWQQHREPRARDTDGFLDGYWFKPFVSERNAIEHAAQMADRWNRIYMRTLRNLRDLRRYSVPVTINNPRQVNIAADGGQQINVSKDEQS